MQDIYIKANGNTLILSLADNSATRELLKQLTNGDITIRMADYGGFEKVGALPTSLPTSNARITTTAGDVMLYNGNQLVIFYAENSWSYTRIGRINGKSAEELRKALGSGDVNVALSISK